jgi:aminomethyltransferase
MGYPLHGHEISPTISPLSAGLGWVVKLKRDIPFIGQEALQREAATGSARVLKAFVTLDRRIPRQGYRVADADHTTVGDITSGTFSPHRNSPIALGFVEKRVASAEKLFMEIREAYVEADIVKLPFVPSHTKKNTA